MDTALKDRWLEALRSGKYTQGKAALCRNGQFCCLGVLADIEGALVEPPNGKYDTGQRVVLDEGGSPWSGFLPSSLQDRWGLDARTVDPIDPLVTTTAHYAVADLNDRDHSFVEIADWIEANV